MTNIDKIKALKMGESWLVGYHNHKDMGTIEVKIHPIQLEPGGFVEAFKVSYNGKETTKDGLLCFTAATGALDEAQQVIKKGVSNYWELPQLKTVGV